MTKLLKIEFLKVVASIKTYFPSSFYSDSNRVSSFQAVASTLFVAVASEAQILAPGLAAPYAAVDAKFAYGAPITALNAAPYGVAAPAVAAPVAAYAAAPARDAVLTTIKLNPGHATFYRVD